MQIIIRSTKESTEVWVDDELKGVFSHHDPGFRVMVRGLMEEQRASGQLTNPDQFTLEA